MIVCPNALTDFFSVGLCLTMFVVLFLWFVVWLVGWWLGPVLKGGRNSQDVVNIPGLLATIL